MVNKNFPESEHVTSVEDGKVTDLEIWDYAKENNFIIVTYDEDFYEWQQLKSFPPNIVWLRIGNAPTNRIAQQLNSNKYEILKMARNKYNGILEIHG